MRALSGVHAALTGVRGALSRVYRRVRAYLDLHSGEREFHSRTREFHSRAPTLALIPTRTASTVYRKVDTGDLDLDSRERDFGLPRT